MTEPSQIKAKNDDCDGASRGIGARITKAFLERVYNVVATSRKITESGARRFTAPGDRRGEPSPRGAG